MQKEAKEKRKQEYMRILQCQIEEKHALKRQNRASNSASRRNHRLDISTNSQASNISRLSQLSQLSRVFDQKFQGVNRDPGSLSQTRGVGT